MHADLNGSIQLGTDEWGDYQVHAPASNPEATPKISVLLPAKNGFDDLVLALIGLQKQTFQNFEIILIDDGSDSPIFERLPVEIKNDPKLTVVRQKNLGVTKSLIRASRLAKGNYLARQDADDFSFPNRLQEQIQLAIEENCNVVLCRAQQQGQAFTRTVPLKYLFKRFSPEILIFGNIFVHGTLLIEKGLLIRNNYDPEIRYAQDFDLFCRLAFSKNEKVKWGLLTKPLYLLKKHQGSISIVNSTPQLQSTRSTLVRFFKTDLHAVPENSFIKKIMWNFKRYVYSFKFSFTDKVVR